MAPASGGGLNEEAAVTEQCKPAIRIWPFKDAPEEWRRLSPFGRSIYADAELVIYVPRELAKLFTEDDWLGAMPSALWFVAHGPKYAGQIQYAGSGFGLYSVHDLSDGSRVVITSGSRESEAQIDL